MACCVVDSHLHSTTLPLPISPPPSLAVILSRMPDVPPEIVTDILSRLPAKSLMRFRSVCKRWYALIDSLDFVKMHFNHSQKTYRSRKLILGFLGTFYVDLASLDCAHPIKPPFSTSDISNSCNGLILVSGQNDSPSVIWNPFTRKYKTLPQSPVEFPPGVEIKSDYSRYGFGYDSVNDDYKVFRAVEFRDSDLQWVGTEAKVYSLKSNSWKKIDRFPYPIPRTRGWGIFANGDLHTLITTERAIVAFDLVSEKCHHIPLPSGLLSGSRLTVVALEGSLCLHSTRKQRTDIWIMKEYGVKESWTKLLSVSPPWVDSQTLVFPIAYSDDRREVLLHLNDEKFVWFDLETKHIKEVTVQGLPFRFYAEFCIETLISPDGFGERDQGKKPFRAEKKCGKVRGKRSDFLSEGFKLVL